MGYGLVCSVPSSTPKPEQLKPNHPSISAQKVNLNKIKRNPHQQPTKFKSLFTSPSYYEYIEKANEYEGHIGKKIWVPHFSGLEKTKKIKKRNKKRENIKGYSYTHDFSSHQDRLDFIVSKRRGKDKEPPHETKAAFG